MRVNMSELGLTVHPFRAVSRDHGFRNVIFDTCFAEVDAASAPPQCATDRRRRRIEARVYMLVRKPSSSLSHE